MGERKVISKYYPPDFDPAKVPRGKRAELNMLKVRMMLPMSIRCGTCGTFMAKGTKFNTKKEDVVGETYLGIQVYRFYMRCSACSAEITFKTDPANTGYSVEAGATRNYEPWRDKKDGDGGGEGGIGGGGGGTDPGGGGGGTDPGGGIGIGSNPPSVPSGPVPGDAMASLEARAMESRREMATLDALDELRAINAGKERVDVGAALAALRGEAEASKNGGASRSSAGGAAGASGPASSAAAAAAVSAAALEAEEDEAAVREMLLARAGAVRRIDDGGDDRDGGGEGAAPPSAAPPPPPPPPVLAASSKRPSAVAAPAVVVLKKKKKKKEEEGEEVKKREEEQNKAEANGSDGEEGSGGGGGGLAGLLGGYGSSSPSS